VIDTYNATTGNAVRHKVVVADVSGRIVRVLEDTAEDGVHYPNTPVLSPDGSVAVWEVYDASQGTVAIRKANVGSGAAAALAPGLSPYAFLDNATLLVQDSAGNPFTLPVTGGTEHAVNGLPIDAIHATLNPAGNQLAFGLLDNVADGSPYTASIQVAPITLADGIATVGTGTTIASGLYNKQPSFSRDGSTVYFVREDGMFNTPQGYSGPGDIWSASATATDTSTQSVTSATVADERDVALAATDDGTTPSDPTSTPATPSGTTATVRWTEPTDADLSGVLVSRNGGAAHYVPAPQTSFVDSGLVPGTTYTYTFTSVDRSGNLGSTPATRQLTALAVGAVFADPTSATSATSSFRVKFATAAPSSVTFTVDYLVVGTTTGYHRWVTSAPGLSRTFGSAAGTGVAATSSPPGRNYVFRVKATDAYGNSTGTATSGRATVPYDQTKATLSGGVNMGSRAYYQGTVRRMASKTNYARVALYGNRLQIIGTRCATCGQFALYDGSTKIATVDTRYSRTVNRTVLFTRLTTLGNHTYTIRPLATAGRPNVILDGFAMRR
jgi:hypothetical protein